MLKISGKTVISLKINGHMHEVAVRPADILLEVLRGSLGLTGTKIGCENGDCGACTVLLDGWPVKSCLMLAVEAVSHEISTIEGLSGTPVQQAFVRFNAFQCGFCTPGFIVVCHASHTTPTQTISPSNRGSSPTFAAAPVTRRSTPQYTVLSANNQYHGLYDISADLLKFVDLC